MSDIDKDWEREKIEFETALSLRNFEIDNFWKRGWFFGALLLALFTAFFQLRITKDNTSKYCIYVAFLSLVVAIAQTLMNRGSKYWQERYEYVTKNRESVLKIDATKLRKYQDERAYIDMCIRAKGENFFTRSIRFSVSKITILLWDVITIFCFFLWVDAILFYKSQIANDGKVLFVMVLFHLVIIYYLYMVALFNGKLVELLMAKKNLKPQRNNIYYDSSEDYVENKDNLKRSV